MFFVGGIPLLAAFVLIGLRFFFVQVSSTSTTGLTSSTVFSTTSSTLFLPGDSNRDGHVNVLDLANLAAAYGRTEGQTHYDARADFNGDGAVGYADLVILAENFRL